MDFVVFFYKKSKKVHKMTQFSCGFLDIMLYLGKSRGNS